MLRGSDTSAVREQASILSDFKDPFPVREFMDLHMLVGAHTPLALCRAASLFLPWLTM